VDLEKKKVVRRWICGFVISASLITTCICVSLGSLDIGLKTIIQFIRSIPEPYDWLLIAFTIVFMAVVAHIALTPLDDANVGKLPKNER
jgi:uncharacterized membrane protein YbhN (UPF0104 family)